METWELKTDDVDGLTEHLTKVGSDNEEIQLSAGKLGFRARVIELPGVRIRWNRFGQSLLFRQVIQEDGFNFGFLLDGSPPLRHSGNHIPAGQGIVQAPLSEHEYVSGRETESLIVHVNMDIVKKLGWHVSPDVTHGVRTTVRNHLFHQCKKITSFAQSNTPIDLFSELELRDSLLDHLALALEPWFSAKKQATSSKISNNSAYNVFRRAVNAVSKMHWDSISVPLLAKHLKVSERTLYRSFNQWVGIGPYEFFRLRRLHTFRNHLLSGPPVRGKIARVARDTGFEDLSRLSQLYLRHFGELPSETMAKRH